MKQENKGCGKRLPTKQLKVRDSLYCNKYQLCKSCKLQDKHDFQVEIEKDNKRLNEIYDNILDNPKNHSPSEETPKGDSNSDTSGGNSPHICGVTGSCINSQVEEDTLSSKMLDTQELHSGVAGLFKSKDIKDFIKKIESDLRKKRYPFTYDEVVEIIRKRAGAELLE